MNVTPLLKILQCFHIAPVINRRWGREYGQRLIYQFYYFLSTGFYITKVLTIFPNLFLSSSSPVVSFRYSILILYTSRFHCAESSFLRYFYASFFTSFKFLLKWCLFQWPNKGLTRLLYLLIPVPQHSSLRGHLHIWYLDFLSHQNAKSIKGSDFYLFTAIFPVVRIPSIQQVLIKYLINN